MEVRRVLVDFIFQKWWYPIIVAPAQHGLIKGSMMETQFLNNLITFIKVLSVTLYARPMEEDTEFAHRINAYITEKT